MTLYYHTEQIEWKTNSKWMRRMLFVWQNGREERKKRDENRVDTYQIRTK